MTLEGEKPQESEIHLEETENVQRASPAFPLYSFIFIGCFILVYVFQFTADKGGAAFNNIELSALLAGFDKHAFINGEYWRILTGFTLHGSLIHLLMNCYAVYVLGKLVETLSNRAHLAIVFLLSGIGGGILSLIFLPDGLSVGASGGITGFLGYLVVYGYRRRELLPKEFLKNMLFNVGFIALYGIALYNRIDNFAHLGGLLVGALYGFFQISGDAYTDPRKVGDKIEIAGLAALVSVITISIFSILVLMRIV